MAAMPKRSMLRPRIDCSIEPTSTGALLTVSLSGKPAGPSALDFGASLMFYLGRLK
jgi:hypothetical protein